MSPTVVLITGANRGLGRGILELYLQKPNHTVIAANRDPSHPTSKSLEDLPKAEGTTLHVIKIDATSPTDPETAVKELVAVKGIKHIDILIANAGIATNWPKVVDVTIEDIQKHFDVNVYGFISLYKAFRPLLKEAKEPKWVTIGSSAAILTVSSINHDDCRRYSSLTSTVVSNYAPFGVVMGAKFHPLTFSFLNSNYLPMQNAAYAPSKAVQHWYTKAIAAEDPWLNAFPVDPGWVQTDLGNRGAHAFGVDKARTTVQDSATGVVKVIDASTRETHSGKLFHFEGSELAW